MTNGEVVGTPPTSDQLARLADLKRLFAPEVGILRVEAYAKWAFGGTAAVSAIAGAYSTVLLGTLSTLGRIFVASGLSALALAMAFAALTLAPSWVRYNENSIDSMEAGLTKQFERRRWTIQGTCWCFALALVLYGSAPVISNWQRVTDIAPGHVSATYSATASGIGASMSAAGLQPGDLVCIRLERVAETTRSLMAEVSAEAGVDGAASTTLAPSVQPSESGEYCLTFMQKREGVEHVHSVQHLPLRVK